MNKTLKLVFATGSLVVSLVLAGCGLGTTTSQAFSSGGATQATVTGKLKGGQQPVLGSTVYLYGASTSGYGAQSITTTLNGGSPVTTDANGNFNVTGVSCGSCSPGTEMYLVLAGGNAGAGNNSSAVWMSALGRYDGLGSLPFLQVNEITTVATAYALAPFFGSDYAHLGTNSSNVQGLTNAFSLVNSLVNIGTGWGGGTALPSGATVTTDSLYALADIIASCVNSSGGSPCSSLFAQTGSVSDTAMASVTIAKNTSTNVTNLFNLMPTQQVFTTGIISAPNDWSLAISYTDSSLSGASSPAVDSGGNLWVANTGSSKVTKITPSGSVSSYSLSLAPNALAIDNSGNVWVAAGSGTGPSDAALYELNSSGATISPSPCSDSSLNNPTAVTIDSSGNIWLSNTGSGANSLTEFSPSCSETAVFTGAGVSGGIAIASGAH